MELIIDDRQDKLNVSEELIEKINEYANKSNASEMYEIISEIDKE